ncbi:MAG: BRCT domain-containing protein [Parasporobacterium sp.]|nr:BRCT domain-containing protein [Parasporobacterium sp.]
MWASLVSKKDYVDFFRDNTFTFTGKLNLMDRAEAFRFVKLCGGGCSKNLTKRTNVLVVGSFRHKECYRNKYHAALKYNEQGQNIKIISEDLFYQMLLMFFLV